MNAPLEPQTGSSTRQFFQDPTAAGWQHFVERYGPKIHDWCRQGLRLAPGLVDDVAQTVVVQLWEQMRGGRAHWDPARGHLHPWLRTVVGNACKDALKKHRPTVDLLESDRVCVDFAEQLARAEVVELAQQRARARVGERKWEAFRLLEVERLSGQEVARQVGIGVGTVYNYAAAVRKVLQEELEKLEDEA
jgi:RNA polymerase sigma factor (sigma-70 family)